MATKKTLQDARRALIASAAAAVKKTHRGSISDVASAALEYPSVFVSTGSLSLDRLCSGMNPGGVPIGPRYGCIVHIAGEWACAKTLVLDQLFLDVLVRLKGLAKRTETEGTASPHFPDAIGLPTDLLSIDRPESFEQAQDMFETWHEDVRKQDKTIPVLWGFDSLDSTEADKSAGQQLGKSGGWHYGGGRAEVLGAMLRRTAKICSRYPTTLVMLNQTRDNVGVMFGPKKRTPGGNPPHFYCVTPEMRVLTSDLRWVPAGKLTVGDALLAFDDHPIRGKGQKSTRRKTLGANVTHAGIIQHKVYSLRLTDGTVLRSSAEHPWLVAKKRNKGSSFQAWETTEQIARAVLAGKSKALLRFTSTWDAEDSYDAGWFAGILDGEGCVHFRKMEGKGAGAIALTLAQKPGIVMSTIRAMLDERKIKYYYSDRTETASAAQLGFTGEWHDRLATLGMFRPKRLLETFDARVKSGQFRMDVCSKPSWALEVVEVAYEGEQDVVALSTSSGTYFAEGFGAHNSSLEVWLSGSTGRGGKGFVRTAVTLPKFDQATMKHLGLYDVDDAGAVIGRYIKAKSTKTKVGTTLDTSAEFYLDFRRGMHRWEGLVERLVLEGMVRTNKDMSEFEVTDKTTGEVVKMVGKRACLNYIAQHLDMLNLNPAEAVTPNPPELDKR